MNEWAWILLEWVVALFVVFFIIPLFIEEDSHWPSDQ